jgi:hypothetical protein
VLIDPIATNIHHSRTTREVVYTRLDTCQRSFEDFVFKKELWTSALVRKLPWHAASFRLDDCVPQTPSLIAVGVHGSHHDTLFRCVACLSPRWLTT